MNLPTRARTALIAVFALTSCASFHGHALRHACAARNDNYVRLQIDGTVTWNDVKLKSMDDLDKCLEVALGVEPIAQVHFSVDTDTPFEKVDKFLKEVTRKAGSKLKLTFVVQPKSRQ